MVIFKTKEGIVPANETSIMFTDVTISDSSIIEVYFTSDEVYVTAISQEGTSVFITCSQHSSAVGIKLFINNVEEFSPYDDTEVKDDIDSLEGDVGNINTTLEGMAGDISELNTGKQDKLPTVVNNRYLHTNETTGDLEWSEVQGGGSASDIIYDNTSTGLVATNVQNAIDEVFQSVSNGKELIADAITDKGVETSADDSFQTMANNISNISGGGVTSLEFADAHFVSGYSLQFTAENSGWLYIVYNEYNCGNGNQTCKLNNYNFYSRTNWKANGNQRTDFLLSRVIQGETVYTNNTNYGGASRIIAMTSNKPPSSNIVNFDNNGVYFNAVSGSYNYSFVARKSGTLHCNMAEQNVGSSGNLTVNGVSASRTNIWNSGNIWGKYFTATVTEGDVIYLGANQWYSTSFLRALCIIV